jgi:hypothetical protein
MLTGCINSKNSPTTNSTSSEVFSGYEYVGSELVVRFQDEIEVRKAILFDENAEETYQTIEQPNGSVQFTVIYPDRNESLLSKSLYVKAKTAEGWSRHSVWEPIHGVVKSIDVKKDGRVLFDIENTGTASLLVRFVGIYGDVPNPTVDPQSNDFDRDSFELGPGVVGTGHNRPLNPTRTDLVVSPKETATFETLYAPFAFTEGATEDDCAGTEESAEMAIVHASGKIASYSFTYTASGNPVVIEGRTSSTAGQQTAEACEVVETSRS